MAETATGGAYRLLCYCFGPRWDVCRCCSTDIDDSSRRRPQHPPTPQNPIVVASPPSIQWMPKCANDHYMHLVGGQEGVLFECPKCHYATLSASRYTCAPCDYHLCKGCAESNNAENMDASRLPQQVQGITVRGEGGFIVSAGATQTIDMHQL